MFTCSQCEKKVARVWSEQAQRYEPVSRYWRGQNIEMVFCGPECSLAKHEAERKPLASS